MIAIVWGGASNQRNNQAMAQWCADRLWPDGGAGFGPCTTMGVLLGTRLIAVVVFHNWQPDAAVIELSAAATSKRWLSRRVLHAMFAYVFDGVGAQLAVMRTSPDNAALSRMVAAYGFKCHRIARLRGRNTDELINTLTDDDWRCNRFERRIHGQTISTGADAS